MLRTNWSSRSRPRECEDERTPARTWRRRELRTLGSLTIVLGLVLPLTACVSAARNPSPPQLGNQVAVAGVSGTTIRYWGDELPPDTGQLVQARWAQVGRVQPDKVAPGARPVVNYLAISGGGSDGAFGAGILNGWTARGDRPQFDLVTGVSTGALTAPFAFLGPKYDGALKQVFTTSTTKDIALIQPVKGLLGGSSLASNAPLAKIIAHYVTADFLREIAVEHAKGRRLYVGTTNLDAQRPVIWNMGAIASSGSPEAVTLFRQILLSSAAIPGAFPPGIIKVSANGTSYDEMHVDGGTTRQVFLFPPQLRAKDIDSSLGIKPRRRAYIIRNGRVGPEWAPVKPSLLSIGPRSVSTLIKTQGIGDLYELYELSRINNVSYNLLYIPGSFHAAGKPGFSPEYMTSLYNEGFRLGRSSAWLKEPPLLD